MITNWLKIAFKNYQKNWVATFINVLGLTLGLTGFILITLHWNDEASYESWNPEKENIYFVQNYYAKDDYHNNNISVKHLLSIKETFPDVVEDYLLVQPWSLNGKFEYKNETYFATDGIYSSEHFFEFFPFEIIAGKKTNALKNKQDIAISQEISEKLFGKTQSAGKTIMYEGEPKIIVTVYRIPESNSVVKPKFILFSERYVSQMISIKNGYENWGNNFGQGLIKIKKGTDIEALEKDIQQKVTMEQRFSEKNIKNSPIPEPWKEYGPNKEKLTRLDKTYLHAEASLFYDKGNYDTILYLFILSVLIVILSAINFINLKTAQASQRAKEVGLRKTIGSGKKAIILQFMLETFLLCITALVLSFFLTELVLPQFNKFLGKSLQFNELNVFLYAIGFTLLVSSIAGFITAMYLSNFKPIATLKGNFSRSNHGIWLRNAILSIQIIISSFFIIGGIIVNQQVKFMMNKDLGFNGDQIIRIDYANSDYSWKKYERIKNELQKIKGVVDITFGEIAPMGGGSSSNVDYKKISVMTQHGAMDYNFLDFFDIPILEGRNISPNFSSDTINHILVNESYVRQIGKTPKEAINAEVHPGFDTIPYKIIGVVKDYNVWGLKNEIPPIAFFNYMTTDWKRELMHNLLVKLDKSDIDGSLQRIKTFWENKAEPGYPFQYTFINKEFENSFKKYQKQSLLLSILNTIVLLVALLGLFALSALMIEQKLKTVAIKKTLGAENATLIFGLTKQFLIITTIAVLISIPISYYFMNEWLKDFAYRIDMPWWPYALSLIILLVLTFLVVSIKAWRATQINLVKYLKYE